MTSPWERGADSARFYTVTEPQRHPRGYTVYKVTARVSAGERPVQWGPGPGGPRWGPWGGERCLTLERCPGRGGRPWGACLFVGVGCCSPRSGVGQG